MTAVVSRRTGIVREVSFVELDAGDPAFHWAVSRPAATLPVLGVRALNDGNSTSIDRERAFAKAVGESVERYCSAVYDEGALVTATYDELDEPATPPEDYALFDARQYAQPSFRFAPFTRSTTVRWVRGRSLVHGRPTWAPAQFVYVPYTRASGEARLRDQISTGLAAAPTLRQAAYRAVCEAVERDAFTIVWQNRLARPQLDLGAVDDPFVRRLLDAFAGTAVRQRAALLTLDVGIPVVLVVNGAAAPPYTSIGVGVDLSPTRALALALEESGLGFLGMSRYAAAEPDYRPRPDFSDVVDLRRHGLAHAVDPSLRDAMEFLFAGETIDVRDVEDRSSDDPLGAAVDAVAARGHDVVVFDLTTDDVDGAGYAVVRAVVPGLVPLDNDHTAQHLGGRRLHAFANGAGFNPLPHPFP